MLHHFLHNSGLLHLSSLYSYVGGRAGGRAGRQGRQADEIEVNFDFFKTHVYIETFNFSLRLTKVRHHYSSTNVFQVVFSGKNLL